MPQQYCAFCDAPITKPTGPASPGTRRLERLIDDLLRLDSAGRARDDRQSLAARLMKYPVPIGPGTSTIPHLSHALRYNFFRRLSERQIEARDPTERGPLTLWVRLTRAAENHNGLVGMLTDRLSETAGLGPASSSREPDLAALLRAATRLHEDRSTPVATRAAPYRDIYGYVKVRNVITTKDCTCAGKVATWSDVELIATRLREDSGKDRLGWQDTKAVFDASNEMFPIAEAMCGGSF